jgi:hypothetical protein
MRALLRGLGIAVAIYVALLALGRIAESRYGPVTLAVAIPVLLLGGAVAWLSTRGQRGRRADRDPRDTGDTEAAGSEHMGPE